MPCHVIVAGHFFVLQQLVENNLFTIDNSYSL